ncbi:hypothetical protein TTHT_1921 [Thermotomaculum hydrothermale]|uniref:Uncharacterized protein n=1 Tax=Thermotomaculum hydrothermale TaxID=981385 RepID=A0A7R6Q0M3_9BACT|nr:hypothetical protein [Thermotomaculum hydrothermale]BBB33373.1 hypothetical protein TTHT_1921 [Thermotomaculum hydrothermale]
MGNYKSGIISTIVILVLLAGFWGYQSNVKTKVKNKAESYLTEQLDRWKSGKLNNKVWRIMPSDFKGDLREWKEYKLSDYFIDKIEARSRYVRRRTLGRKRGIWYYLDKLSSSNVYIYADVELDMENPDGYPETFNIRYRLEPVGNGDFRIFQSKKFKLF